MRCPWKLLGITTDILYVNFVVTCEKCLYVKRLVFRSGISGLQLRKRAQGAAGGKRYTVGGDGPSPVKGLSK